ncbi:MAG TPA: threonine/serine dehydratase [Gemmatimonadota bacterium]|nr:threonine/serine dehydratase [Gemmatimonadota bacterium]
MTETDLVTLDDVFAAREVVAGRIHRTPLLRSTSLGERHGVELWFKVEAFQKTGSFKVRGVLNRLAGLTDQERARGVVTLSAGNHAQALAWAAAREGIPATVVMPAGADRGKVEATRGYGGEVILTEAGLLDTTLQVRDERDLVLVHPFDDPAIIAGQGTVGLEIVEEMPGVDAVFVGVGGGGLISGVATAVEARRPEARVIGVEPEGAAAMSRSLEAGEPVTLDALDTVADGLAAPFAGEITFAHVKERVERVLRVPDRAIVAAMREILERVKVVAEPAAAAGLAGLASGAVDLTEGSTVVCVISGGNVGADRLAELLGSTGPRSR